MIDNKAVADAANMIINGYAFTQDGENIKVLNLNNTEMAIMTAGSMKEVPHHWILLSRRFSMTFTVKIYWSK